MPYTMEDFTKDFLREHLHLLPPEERLKGLPYTMEDFTKDFLREHLHLLPPEERLKDLPPEERLTGLSEKEIIFYPTLLFSKAM